MAIHSTFLLCSFAFSMNTHSEYTPSVMCDDGFFSAQKMCNIPQSKKDRRQQNAAAASIETALNGSKWCVWGIYIRRWFLGKMMLNKEVISVKGNAWLFLFLFTCISVGKYIQKCVCVCVIEWVNECAWYWLCFFHIETVQSTTLFAWLWFDYYNFLCVRACMYVFVFVCVCVRLKECLCVCVCVLYTLFWMESHKFSAS